MIDKALSLLAPHICCNCRAVGSLLCSSCENDIVEECFSQCVKCLIPTPSSNLCKSCGCNTPYCEAYVVGYRQEALKRLLDVYKFERGYESAEIAARLLDKVLPILPDMTVIVPIPTIARHRRVRGYGHTELVARHLAKRRKLQVGNVLVRASSVVQHGASKKIRYEQAERMFHLQDGVPHTPILLLDDIYTTGATVEAAARLLGGVRDQPIYLAVIARQPLDDSDDLW